MSDDVSHTPRTAGPAVKTATPSDAPSSDTSILRATQRRRKARRAYTAALSQSSLLTLAPNPTPQQVLTSAEAHVLSVRAALEAYVTSVYDLLTLACNEHVIPELTVSASRQIGTERGNDICRELSALFSATVSRPGRALRQVLERRGVDGAVRLRVRQALRNVLNVPFLRLYAVGDVLIRAFLRTLHGSSGTRYRDALLLLLMHISDCHRYLYNNASARGAAQLMRLIAPGDAEAHMRLALAGAQDGADADGAQTLQHFFHYCTFLANRDVDLRSDEAIIVHNFVKACRNGLATGSKQRKGEKDGKEAVGDSEVDDDTQQNGSKQLSAFAPLFVDTVWTCLTEGVPKSIKKVRDDQLWASLEAVLQCGSLKQVHCQFVVGALVYASHKVSTSRTTLGERTANGTKQTDANTNTNGGGDNDASTEHDDVVDELISRFIVVLLQHTVKGLQTATVEARRRRKNRRRSMQKRRSSTAHVANATTATGGSNPKEDAICSDILQRAFDVDGHAPALGALSFLCSFFSERRRKGGVSNIGIAPTLREATAAIESLLGAAGVSAFGSHIASKVAHVAFPALSEDLALQHVRACTGSRPLRGVARHDVALAALLTSVSCEGDGDGDGVGVRNGDGKGKDGVLRKVLEQVEEQQKTYEDVAGETAARHLAAFALQRAKGVNGWRTSADRESLGKVVRLAVRRERLRHLLVDLERLNGSTTGKRRVGEVYNGDVDKHVSTTNDKGVNTRQEAGNRERRKGSGGQTEVVEVIEIEEDGNDPDIDMIQKNDRTAAGAAKEATETRKGPDSANESLLQERITESDLDGRARKRRKLQGGLSLASGSPVVPRDSHEGTEKSGGEVDREKEREAAGCSLKTPVMNMLKVKITAGPTRSEPTHRIRKRIEFEMEEDDDDEVQATGDDDGEGGLSVCKFVNAEMKNRLVADGLLARLARTLRDAHRSKT